MTPAERWCPVHAGAGVDEARAWACPDDCQDFLAELEHRIDDVQVHGNFTRTWRSEDGVFYKQQFRNHEPVGEPEAFPVRHEARGC